MKAVTSHAAPCDVATAGHTQRVANTRATGQDAGMNWVALEAKSWTAGLRHGPWGILVAVDGIQLDLPPVVLVYIRIRVGDVMTRGDNPCVRYDQAWSRRRKRRDWTLTEPTTAR